MPCSAILRSAGGCGFDLIWLLTPAQDSSKSALPSFWVPSLTPSTDHDEITANKAVKLTPMCPGSNETHKHTYSLKSLVDVHFTEEKADDGTVLRVCPSCKKNLSNGLKAMRTYKIFTVVAQLMRVP